MTTVKTWYYKNGADKEPIPIILTNLIMFQGFNVITFREIREDGSLGVAKQDVIRDGEAGLGENLKLFPEIKTNYCKNCGETE